MSALEERSAHLVVTSPPYWQLKDYGPENQIGYDEGYEEYINNLNMVWMECERVLHDGCKLCVNIGDQFARSVYYGRYKVIPIRTEIIRFCETIGLDYMGAIIWQKATTTHSSGGGSVMGSYPYPRNGILRIDYEFILVFKKQGKPPKIDPSLKEKARLTKAEWNEYFSGHWTLTPERQEKHLAMFPVELPKRLIKMFTFHGETVLDPFMGSGSTACAAIETGRNSIGFELNQAFIPVYREKTANCITNPDEVCTTVKSVKVNTDEITNNVEKLPYHFTDNVKIKRGVNSNKKQFRSKIRMADQFIVEEKRTVKEIINPCTVKLDNNERVELLGIVPKENQMEEAMNYLVQKVLHKSVIISDKNFPQNSEKPRKVYIHLPNRTFINAHMIKRNLVNIDSDLIHHHLNRFMKYQELSGKS